MCVCVSAYMSVTVCSSRSLYLQHHVTYRGKAGSSEVGGGHGFGEVPSGEGSPLSSTRVWGAAS